MVSVPRSVTGLFASNSVSNEWCAHADVAAKKRPTQMAKRVRPFVIVFPPAPAEVTEPSTFCQAQFARSATGAPGLKLARAHRTVIVDPASARGDATRI